MECQGIDEIDDSETGWTRFLVWGMIHGDDVLNDRIQWRTWDVLERPSRYCRQRSNEFCHHSGFFLQRRGQSPSDLPEQQFDVAALTPPATDLSKQALAIIVVRMGSGE